MAQPEETGGCWPSAGRLQEEVRRVKLVWLPASDCRIEDVRVCGIWELLEGGGGARGGWGGG